MCPITNPGDSNTMSGHRAFFGWAGAETQPDNFSLYDMAVTSHVPLFVATWLKSTGNTTAGPSGVGWADTQILCIPANQTQPGSRSVAGTQTAQTSQTSQTPQTTHKGTAVKIGGMGNVGVFGGVGLTILFGLFV